MSIRNPLADPLFLPALAIVGALLVFGFGLVLFFARHDFKAGLKGELGQRFIGWLIIAPLFLIGTFVGGPVAAALLLLVMARVVFEYVRLVAVERAYAVAKEIQSHPFDDAAKKILFGHGGAAQNR